jgi:hypothetical protein
MKSLCWGNTLALSLTLVLLAQASSAPAVVATPQTNKEQKEQNAPPPAPAPSVTKPAIEFRLSEDTPIRLRLGRTISSSTEKANDKVDFEVLEAVKIGDVVVIPQGATAIATVTEAKHKGRMGKGGKLNVNIDYVQDAVGDKIPLRAVKGGSGGNHTGAMTGAIVATSILFFPAAPFFLFMKGKDITIPKGTEITAYVAADTALDRARFASK